MVHADHKEIYRFLDQFELNGGFESFVRQCRRNDVDLIVLSDGLDFYIRYVLERHGLSEINVIANRGCLEDHGLKVTFPFDNPLCHRCGSCKGERIREYRARHPEAAALFVGDGYSDACAVTEADLVFAKKDLEQYCLKHNIDHVTYDTFIDVSRHLVERGYMKD